MSDDSTTNRLHLPDLSITNFRGIDGLSIRRLGRVTLLGGRNRVGKTTVLEAVRVHAARGRARVLHDLLQKREEFATALDEDNDPVVSPDYAALFYGRIATKERPITIGPNSGNDELRLEASMPSDWSARQKKIYAELVADLPTGSDAVQAVINVSYRKQQRLLWLPIMRDPRVTWPRRRYPRGLFEGKEWPVIECESLGPGLPSNNTLSHFWDSVALTDKEDLSLEALHLTGNGVERVAVVGDEEPPYRSGIGRRVVVKLRTHSRPVPLKSLGDGATRLFAAGLALANSHNGFMVIDEAENGIHYSVQQDFWRMVLRASHQHNVQVLATTHSFDCLRGFARAAVELREADGVYLRLERDGERVRAVEYTEEELATVAEHGIEVR